jgi:low affinity Fe/Cu permease
MSARRYEGINRLLENVACRTTLWTGSSWAFMVAAGMTILWLISGPLFHYSDTWQLVMNTVSSIVTFLMVFLIQRSQNKESLAMQVKLNELIAAVQGASNRLINIEERGEDEVRRLHQRDAQLAKQAAREPSISESLSIEDTAPAGARHAETP